MLVGASDTMLVRVGDTVLYYWWWIRNNGALYSGRAKIFSDLLSKKANNKLN